MGSAAPFFQSEADLYAHELQALVDCGIELEVLVDGAYRHTEPDDAPQAPMPAAIFVRLLDESLGDFGWRQVSRTSAGTAYENTTNGMDDTTHVIQLNGAGDETGFKVGATDGVMGIAIPIYQDGGILNYMFDPITLGRCFPCKVTKTGGVSGGTGADCTWVYTVKDIAGTTLATSVSPEMSRMTNVEYEAPAADSWGIAAYTQDGLKLLAVCQEVPATTTINEVVTDLQVSGTTIQYKYRKVTVLTADAESGWGTWHTGAACA